MALILASASPRRREILTNAGIEFTLRPASVDESLRDGESAEENVRRLAEAKARALEMAADYTVPDAPEIALPGPTARVAFELAVGNLVGSGQATEHDGVVARTLGEVISGGATDVTESVSENDLLALERKALTSLVRLPATLDRMAHMLETGKPLRN